MILDVLDLIEFPTVLQLYRSSSGRFSSTLNHARTISLQRETGSSRRYTVVAPHFASVGFFPRAAYWRKKGQPTNSAG